MEREKASIACPALAAAQQLIRRYRWAVYFSNFKRMLASVPVADFMGAVVAAAAIMTIEGTKQRVIVLCEYKISGIAFKVRALIRAHALQIK